MFHKRQSILRQAVWAVAPASVLAANLVLSPQAFGVSTWIGTTGSFGDAANWEGSPIPPTSGDLSIGGPSNGSFTNNTTWPALFIGNNGVVNLNGIATGIERIRLGYAGPGQTNPGTGVLNLNSGSIMTDQDSFIGDGAAGTMNITGGTFYTKDTKHVVLGALSDGAVTISGGSLILSRYGFEHGAGFSTFIMSGGTVDFFLVPNNTLLNNTNQIAADYVEFTGGNLGGLAGLGTATIHKVSGSGNISLRPTNSGVNGQVVFDLSGDDLYSGSIGAGSTALAAGSMGVVTKTGPGTLTMTGLQGYKRITQVNGGTLVLDYSVNAGGVLDNTSSISLGGGVLKLKGNSVSATSQVVARLGFTSGGSTLILDKNGGPSITLDVRGTDGTVTLNRADGSGATVDIVTLGGGVLGTDANIRIANNNTNGILGGHATVNNFADWAASTNAGTDSLIIAYTGYQSTDPGLDNTKNYLLSSGVTNISAGSFLGNSIKLTGAAGISMTGDGSMLLSGGGILAQTTGSISGGTISSVGSETFVATAQDLTINSSIGGTSLVKSGPGILTLSGAHSYNGTTFVNGGVLRLAGNLPNNTTISFSNSAGAVLELNGLNQQVTALVGGGTAGGEVRLGANVLTLSNGADGTYGGVITGTGGLIKDQGGIATFTNNNTYTGATTISGGVLAVTRLRDGGLASGIGASSSAASNLVISNNGTLRFVGRVTTSTDRLFTVGEQGATIDAFGLIFPLPSNASDGMYGAVNFTNTGALAMGGSPGERTLAFQGSAGPIIGGNLPALNSLESTFAPVIANSGVGTVTNVTKRGTNQWALLGANTYTGATQVEAGTLRATVGVGLPSGSRLVLNGGTFMTSGAFTRSTGSSAGSVELNGTTTGFAASPGTSLTVNLGGGAAVLQWGQNGFNPNPLLLADRVTFANPLDLFGGGDTRSIAVSTGVATVSAVVSNSQFNNGGGLVKTGGGVLVLPASNTYGGSTTISAGVLRANSGAGIPTATNLMLDGGVVESSVNITRPLFTNEASTGQVAVIGTASGFGAFGAPISVDLGGDGSGTGPLIQWGNGSFNPGTFTLNAGSSDNTLTFRNPLDMNGGANRALSVNGGTAVLSGVLSNSGSGGTFSKGGGGVLVMSANNTHAAVVNILGGTLQVASIPDGGIASPLGASTNAAANLILGGGTLRYTGSGQSTDRLFRLTAGGTIESSGSAPLNFTNTGPVEFVGTRVNLALSGTNTGNNTFAPLVADAGAGSITSLTKSGPGKWIVTANNTYTGPTTVKGGQLQLNVNSWTPVLTNVGGADIQRGRLIFDYNGGSAPDVLTILDAAYNQNPRFSSGKLRSSTITNATALAWKDDPSVSVRQVTVAYTYYGDTDLNGVVDIADLGTLASNWQTSGNWVKGDFDYNGTIDINDLGLLASNWQAGAGDPLAPSFAEAAAAVGLPASAVPEPASLGLLGLAAGFVRRRRRAC